MLRRLHSIVWVNFGMGADGTGGRLVGGSENGILTVYNPDVIMTSGADAIVGESDKHTGPIRALDFNPFQVNICSQNGLSFETFCTDRFFMVLEHEWIIFFNLSFLRVISLHLEQMIQRYISGI